MDIGLNISAFYAAHKPPVADSEKTSKAAANEQVHSQAWSVTEPERERVVEAIKRIQEFVDEMQRGLQFSIDEDTGRIVVKVIARQSGEVIRQLPSEEALELAKRLQDAGSLLFSRQV